MIHFIAGMTTALDDGVGLVIQELKNSRLMDNTIIVFTSDVCITHGYSSEFYTILTHFCIYISVLV